MLLGDNTNGKNTNSNTFLFSLPVSTTCGGQLTPKTTEIQKFASPGYPGGYSPDEHCEWIIAGMRNKQQVAIRTNNFETDDSQECKLDQVVIYEGGQNKMNARGQWCLFCFLKSF